MVASILGRPVPAGREGLDDALVCVQTQATTDPAQPAIGPSIGPAEHPGSMAEVQPDARTDTAAAACHDEQEVAASGIGPQQQPQPEHAAAEGHAGLQKLPEEAAAGASRGHGQLRKRSEDEGDEHMVFGVRMFSESVVWVNHVCSGCVLDITAGSGAQEVAAQPLQKRPHVMLSHLGDDEEEGDAGA